MLVKKTLIVEAEGYRLEPTFAPKWSVEFKSTTTGAEAVLLNPEHEIVETVEYTRDQSNEYRFEVAEKVARMIYGPASKSRLKCKVKARCSNSDLHEIIDLLSEFGG